MIHSSNLEVVLTPLDATYPINKTLGVNHVRRLHLLESIAALFKLLKGLGRQLHHRYLSRALVGYLEYVSGIQLGQGRLFG